MADSAPPLTEPFVFPAGREFAPREEQAFKYGRSALDIVLLEDLIAGGLSRHVSFYMTQTVADYAAIYADKFTLRNPLLGIVIPCQVVQRNDRLALHQPALVNSEAVPQKLWHAFRPRLVVGEPPDKHGSQWPYGTREVRLLRLDLEMSLNRDVFHSLTQIMDTHQFKTMPLHLFHTWSYRPTYEEVVAGVRYLRESPDQRLVTSVWKDFIVVVKSRDIESITLGVGSDFHIADRNQVIAETFGESADLHRRVRTFRDLCFKMWWKGKLDFLALNGDLIDYLSLGQAPSTQTYAAAGLDYKNTNWDIVAKQLRLDWEDPAGFQPPGCLLWWFFPWRYSQKNMLRHVPIMWNAGEHDSLLSPYPLPTQYSESALGYDPSSSHYNFANLTAGAAVPAGPFYGSLGEDTSHIVSRRWLHEQARADKWPVHLSIRVGETNFQIVCLDSGTMKGRLDPPPLAPNTLTGLDEAGLSSLTEVPAPTVLVILTHAPVVSLPPEDSRHLASLAAVVDEEASYGVFQQGRQDLLEFLREREGRTLVVSGHVHFRSAYALAANGTIRVGQEIYADLAQISTPEFWAKHRVLFFTTPAVGPLPRNVDAGYEILLIQFGSNGPMGISWVGV